MAAREDGFEAEVGGEQLERSAYSGEVHARPIYLGSGHSEFPCGLDGGAAVLVAAFDDEVTCPACLRDQAARAAHSIPAPKSTLSELVHAMPELVKARDGFVGNAMLRNPCGAEWPYALRKSPAAPTSATEGVTCQGCLVAGQEKLIEQMKELAAALKGGAR